MNKPLVLLVAACVALCLGVGSAWPEGGPAAANATKNKCP